jgi:hypothetical protein
LRTLDLAARGARLVELAPRVVVDGMPAEVRTLVA